MTAREHPGPTESTTSDCCAPGGRQRNVLSSGLLPAGHLARRPDLPGRSRSTRGQVSIPGGSFAMGDAFGEGYPRDGEGPVHEVILGAFTIDATTVTNAAFATFVKATGYVTEAEVLGVSSVFHLQLKAERADVLGSAAGTPWWLVVQGADWRHPYGPASTITELQHHPVVQVTWNDAAAYADWAGKRLPTEAEWEYAARGGLAGARFPWGDELLPRGRWNCNIWQGRFPDHNTAQDGYIGTAPVRQYAPNGYGLFNTVGNVWEWCADWFATDTYATRAGTRVVDPPGPAEPDDTGRRVLRGGSFLCHDSYCHRYRVAARSGNTPDSAASNVGFRCA